VFMIDFRCSHTFISKIVLLLFVVVERGNERPRSCINARVRYTIARA